jgi:hypothetical protein
MMRDNKNSFFQHAAELTKICGQGAVGNKIVGASGVKGCVSSVGMTLAGKAFDAAPNFAYQSGKKDFERQQSNKFYMSGPK